MSEKYFEAFLRFPEFKTRAVTLSFDDGSDCDRLMVEILNRYGIKCTFNVSAGRILENPSMVQFKEFDKVYRGHEIASHSFTHTHLQNLDHGGITYQMIKDREVLEDVLCKPVEGFAYPYGLSETDGLVDCIKKSGMRYGRTTAETHNFDLPEDFHRWRPTCHQADSKFSELVTEFFMADDVEHPWRIKPLLFYLWGHSWEFKDNWQRLEEICEALGKKENVWYTTNIEIIDYISAFKTLRRSVNGKYIYNPTDTDVYVAVNNKNFIIKKGKTTIVTADTEFIK